MCVVAELGEALHTHVPIFKDSMDASAVHLSNLAEWLADSIFDEQEPAGLPPIRPGTMARMLT